MQYLVSWNEERCSVGVVHLADIKFGNLATNTTFSQVDQPEISIRLPQCPFKNSRQFTKNSQATKLKSLSNVSI